MLFKILLVAVVCCALTAADYAAEGREPDSPDIQQQTARFFALQATTTKLKIVTTTLTTTKQSLCASLVNVTGSCQRRRRGVDKPIVLSLDDDDNIDIYQPSQVQKVEPTPLPSIELFSKGEELQSSSDLPVEVDVIGLQSDCLSGRRFGLISGLANALNVTLLYTSKLTATVTLTKTVTSGSKAFIVSGCTPSPFLYSTCA